jgi:hypothetical protein
VGNPLTVNQEKVRGNRKLLTGRQGQRCLPEGQKPGNIGELKLAVDHPGLDQSQVRIAQHNHRPGSYPPLSGRGYIHPGNKTGAGDLTYSGYLSSQPTLYIPRLGGANLPIVSPFNLHPPIIVTIALSGNNIRMFGGEAN